MSILLEHYPIPETGVLEIRLQQTVHIKVTAQVAERKVHFWLVTEVSNLIGADAPTLVILHQRAVWRVPVWIGFPRQGRVGTIGTIDVDVETGQMHNSAECKVVLAQRAKKLAAMLPPYRPQQAVPPEYFVANPLRATSVNLLPDTLIEVAVP
jgi:hypothetical protein